MSTYPEDIKMIMEATKPGYLDNPQRVREFIIAETGVSIVATLIRKNRDYGSSAFESPVLMPGSRADSGILVRMSDKIQRIRSLITGATPNVISESLVDSFRDLAGYCILWIVLFILKGKSSDSEAETVRDQRPTQGPKPGGILPCAGDYSESPARD